MRKLKKKIKK